MSEAVGWRLEIECKNASQSNSKANLRFCWVPITYIMSTWKRRLYKAGPKGFKPDILRNIRVNALSLEEEYHGPTLRWPRLAEAVFYGLSDMVGRQSIFFK